MGPACARGRDQGRPGHAVDRLAEAALRAATGVAAIARHAARQGARRSGCIGPGSYGRNDAGDAAMDAAVLSKAVGKPVRAAIHARRGHRLGPEGPGLDPSRRARRSTRRARSSPTSSTARASRASDVAHQRERSPHDTLAGQLMGVPLKSGDVLRRAGGILRFRPTSGWRGRPSRRCSIAPRRCAPRICAIRSDRRSISPASPSSTKWRRRSAPIRSSSACATSRSRATSP